MTVYSSEPGTWQRFSIKRFLPKALLGRSLLIIGAPLVLVQVIATWMFYDRHYDHVTKRLTQGVAGDIAMVVELMEEDPEAAMASGIVSGAAAIMWLDDVSWRRGARLPDGPDSIGSGILEQKLFRALEGRLDYPFRIDTRSSEHNVKIEIELPDRVLQILVSRDRLFSSTAYIFIIWMVGSSIVLFAVATLFMRNQVRPIRRLAHAAESFGKGQDVPAFKPEGATEVRQAAVAFMQMRDRIKRSISQRTEMLAGVSHDLRTPLTRMKLELALLGDSPEVENLETDVEQMRKMVEGYLAFARGEGTEQVVPTELSALLHDVVEQMRRDGRTIDLHTEERLDLALRPESIRRCLTNLIANAQVHGEQVSIRAGRRNATVEITIDDDGPGIPADKREEVFKPFFRLDDSRNPETGGTGLGLTIARDVVRGHGGDLTLEDGPGGGLRARLWLPV